VTALTSSAIPIDENCVLFFLANFEKQIVDHNALHNIFFNILISILKNQKFWSIRNRAPKFKIIKWNQTSGVLQYQTPETFPNGLAYYR